MGTLVGLLFVAASTAPTVSADGDTVPSALPPTVEMVCETLDGATVQGRLLRLDDKEVVIDSPDGERAIPTATIRSLARGQAPSVTGGPATRISLVSGDSLLGDDLEVSGAVARLLLGDTTIDLPATAIASAEFLREAPAGPSSWLAEVPRTAEGDVVVVGSQESHEFVECVVAGVSKAAVDVVLDGESIAVKRGKVLGLKWLRPTGSPAGAIRLESTAGSIVVASPRLEGDVFVAAVLPKPGAEGRSAPTEVRVPASIVSRIDFSAARSVSLLTTAWLDVAVEPLLGALDSIEELSAAFEPRRVACLLADGRRGDGLRLAPRTTISWQIPDDATRFRATIRPVRGLMATTATASAGPHVAGRFIVTIDGREMLSENVSDERAIDVDLAGGRRLSLVCDYPPAAAGGIGPFGGGMVLIDPRLDR